MLIDSIRHSVFCAGIRVPVVENPALRREAQDPSIGPVLTVTSMPPPAPDPPQ